MEKVQSTESDEILKFLDRTLVESGGKKLLYVSVSIFCVHVFTENSPHVQFSFGSFFWPVSTPHYVWAFLDVVMDLQIPFVSNSNARAAMQYNDGACTPRYIAMRPTFPQSQTR